LRESSKSLLRVDEIADDTADALAPDVSYGEKTVGVTRAVGPNSSRDPNSESTANAQAHESLVGKDPTKDDLDEPSESEDPVSGGSIRFSVSGAPNDASANRLATPMRDNVDDETLGRAAYVSDTRELRAPRAAKRVGVRMRPSTIPGFDPIERLRRSSRRENRIGMTLGLAGALLVHGAGAAHGFSSLLELGSFSSAVRNAVLEDVRATYAVEVAKPPPPPPPTPEAEPPKQEPVQRAPSQAAAPAEPPPAPAQAGKVLTAEADPTEPLDLTDQGFVTGEGERYVGGVTASTGTSKVAVRDTNAQIGGVPGGKGTAAPAPPPPPPKQDLSRPAMPASTQWNDCGFPAEADVEQIDFMTVPVVVTVALDGRAQNVTVLKDPGYGFGRLAKACAMRKTYNVGYDINGKPTVTTSPPITIRFTR
jgi:protein TonB